jgi:hypothetical protein
MINKPLTWKDFFLELPTAMGVHSIRDLQAIRDLTAFDVETTDSAVWYRLSREPDLLFLFLCTSGELQILHHVEILGNRLNPDLKAMGLCGFKSQAPPVSINLERDLIEVSARIPGWDQFTAALTNLETFKNLEVESVDHEEARINALVLAGTNREAAEATRAQNFSHFSFIAIPPGLSRVLIENSDRSPASLALRFWNLMSSLDDEHEGETEDYAPYKVHFKHLIHFLWLAHTRQMHMVPYVLAENTESQDWAD